MKIARRVPYILAAIGQESRLERDAILQAIQQKGGFSETLIAHDDRVRRRCACRNAPLLPGKASFAEKVAGSEHCDNRFLAPLRHDGDLHLAFPDKED
jgi:hypothetical protein